MQLGFIIRLTLVLICVAEGEIAGKMMVSMVSTVIYWILYE
jgi:hypothetical protein